jgi:hypothetical protein
MVMETILHATHRHYPGATKSKLPFFNQKKKKNQVQAPLGMLPPQLHHHCSICQARHKINMQFKEKSDTAATTKAWPPGPVPPPPESPLLAPASYLFPSPTQTGAPCCTEASQDLGPPIPLRAPISVKCTTQIR